MTLTTKRTGYGIHLTTVELEGERFQGAGLSEAEAGYRARVKAVGCATCPTMVLPAEAALSRRAYGRVVCGSCRIAAQQPRLEEVVP